MLLCTYEISIKTYWNNCKTSFESYKKAARFFLSECWVGGGRAVEVLMEYFSDTNVCLVCSQIQSISERSGIFMQKCILVFNIEQRTVNVDPFDCMWWLCLRALFKCWMGKWKNRTKFKWVFLMNGNAFRSASSALKNCLIT